MTQEEDTQGQTWWTGTGSTSDLSMEPSLDYSGLLGFRRKSNNSGNTKVKNLIFKFLCLKCILSVLMLKRSTYFFLPSQPHPTARTMYAFTHSETFIKGHDVSSSIQGHVKQQKGLEKPSFLSDYFSEMKIQGAETPSKSHKAANKRLS